MDVLPHLRVDRKRKMDSVMSVQASKVKTRNGANTCILAVPSIRTDSIAPDGKALHIYASGMRASFHKSCRTVGTGHRSTVNENIHFLKSHSDFVHLLEFSTFTFRLHGCLLQSRIRLHFASHKYGFEHGSSLECSPQRHFFSMISRQGLQSPR